MRTALFIATLLFSTAAFAHGIAGDEIAANNGCRDTLPVDVWLRKGCGEKSADAKGSISTAASTQGCHESLPVDVWLKKGCGGLRSAEVPQSLYLASTQGCHESLPVDVWLKKGCGNLKQANLSLENRGCTANISAEEWARLECGRVLLKDGKWSTSQRDCFAPGLDANSISGCLSKTTGASQQASLQPLQGLGVAGH